MTASARPPSKPIQSSPNWDSVGTRKVALICFFSLLWTQTKAAPMSSVYWSMRLDLEDYTVSKWLDINYIFEDIFPHWMFEFLTTFKWIIFNCFNIAQFWLLSDWLIREGANKKSDHYVRESSWINNKWISAKTAWNLPQFPQFSGKNKEATPWSLSCVFAPLQTMQIGWLEQLESFQWNINKNPQVCCAIKSVKWRHQGGLLWNGSPLWVEEADMRVANTSTFFHSPPLSLPPPPPLTVSWSKKWEIQMLFTFSSLSGFQAIYWGDRFLKLIRHRWHHLAADQRGPGSGKQSKFVINENILTMPSTTSNLIG